MQVFLVCDFSSRQVNHSDNRYPTVPPALSKAAVSGTDASTQQPPTRAREMSAAWPPENIEDLAKRYEDQY